MSRRKDIFDKVKEIVENDSDFKKVFVGVAPAWGNVGEFPACAVMFDTDKAELQNYACDTYHNMNMLLIIYHRHKTNKYGDILSDLIDNLEGKLKDNQDLKDLTVSYYISEIVQDGGILYPFTMAQVSLTIQYIDT